MSRLKYAILIFFTVLLAIVFPSRYLGPQSGVSTSSTDYAVHIVISEHIKEGNLFPNIPKEQVGKNAIASFLPIYHGLLGFHTLGWIANTAGIPLPGAYALIMDLSLITLFIVFIFFAIDYRKCFDISKAALMALFISMFLSYFTASVDAAFYSQLLSQSLLAVSIYFWSYNRKRTSIAFFVFALFCYPDFMIWFAPVLLLKRFPYQIIWKPVLLILMLVLMWVPYQRASLPGPLISSYFLFFCVILIVAFNFKSLWSRERELTVLALTFIIYTTLLTVVTMKFGTTSYYATKLSSFSYLLLPYLLFKVTPLNDLRYKIWISVSLLLILVSSDLWSKYNYSYLSQPVAFKNSDANQVDQIKKEIKNTSRACVLEKSFIVPHNPTNTDFLTIAAYNAFLNNFDIYSLNTKIPAVNDHYKDKVNGALTIFFRDLLAEDKHPLFSSMELIIHSPSKPDLCLVVSKEKASKFAIREMFETMFVGEKFVYFKLRPSNSSH